MRKHRDWWRVAAATAGVGAAIGSGQALAWAAPAEAGQTAADSTSAASGPAQSGSVSDVQQDRRSDRPRLRRIERAERAEKAIEQVGERRQRRREAAVEGAAELSTTVRRDLAKVHPTRAGTDDSARKGPIRDLLGALPVTDHEIGRDRRNALIERYRPSSDPADQPPQAVVDGAAPGRVTDAASAADFLNSKAETIGAPEGFAKADDVKVQAVGTPGGFSETVYRVGHKRDGIEVLGSEAILVTDSDGVVTSVVDNYDSRVDTMDMTLGRDMTTGTGAAATALAAFIGSADPRPYRLLAELMVAVGALKPRLVIDALDDDDEPRLVWRVNIDPPDAPALTGSIDPGSTYYIRANGTEVGTIARAVSNVQPLTIGGPASASAPDLSGQSRAINIARLGLVLFDFDTLSDTVRGIFTNRTLFWFFVGPPLTPGFPEFRGIFGWDTSAVSAHANIAEAYDYYATVLGHTSIDDAGAPVIVNTGYNPRLSLANYTSGYANAFWDPRKQEIDFGDTGDLEAALDVVGHEYTHGVISHVVGAGGSVLDSGESGALNEAYADLLGLLIEDKSGRDRWLIGEDGSMTSGPLRDLADPTSISTAFGPYRAHYTDRYTEGGDEGGEHINSTIFSHAGYLMMTKPATAGVSDEQWAQLYYHSLYQLSAGSRFGNGRAAIVNTAEDMGFSDTELAAIEQAFDDVGIAAAANVIRV